MTTATSSGYRRSSILPPRAFLAALLAQLPLVAASWPLRPAAFEVVAGTVLIAAGVILNVWSERLFRRADVGVCPFSPAPILVTRGPFALSRNPMYLGLVAISAGLAVATGVLANVWITTTLAVWLHHAYVLPEEDFLRDNFGAEYAKYATRVPRWILPRR
jgi:protein-S-isoprenylcysteine O-methyltransferase Ste14